MSTDQTTNLGLPFLMPAQAQKHVTVNESLTRLDALVQTAVESRSVSTQPGSPADGALWIVPAGKTGAEWGGYANWAIAYYRDGAWEPLTPKPGWRAWVKDEELLTVYDGSAWLAVATGDAPELGPVAGFRNVLINGGFEVNQRAPASNADATYCLDRWYALTQSGAIAASRLSDPENGSPAAARLTQSQASAQRMGLAQIVESVNCRHLRGEPVTLWGRVRLSASANVRYAVLEWTGSSDSVVSDVVNDWTSGTYTAGNFFKSSNLNVLAVGAVACTADTWRDLDALNASVGASATNLIVLAWTEGTAAQNVTLDLGRMQLEPGSVATPFERRPFGVELALCQRYFFKTFPLDTAPAQNAGRSGAALTFGISGSYNHRWQYRLPTTMRSMPSRTFFNPDAANAQARNIDAPGGADCTNTTSFAFGQSPDVVDVFATTPASTDPGDAILVHFTADAEL